MREAGSPQPRTPLAVASYCTRVFRDYWIAGLPVGGARSLQKGYLIVLGVKRSDDLPLDTALTRSVTLCFEH